MNGTKIMRSILYALLLSLWLGNAAVANDSRVQPQQPLDLAVDTSAPRPDASITPA